MDLTDKKKADLRKTQLWDERNSWLSHWREISEYQQPRLGRFLVTDRNKGERRNKSIYDRTATGAARVLAAGMMSGMTSPARPWFKLGLADKDLMEFGPVKSWLFRVGGRLREVFAASNTYRALHAGYHELGLFGTWATVLDNDFDNVVHHHPLTIGEFAIGTNAKGVVDTLAREYQMTVGQMVRKFGLNGCGSTVKNLYDRHQLDAWVTVCHLIEPNDKAQPDKADNLNMRWRSCYYEPDGTEDKFLSRSGYRAFPVLAPRWDLAGQDIYGSSPGMEALGDVKQLQHQQLRKSQGIDYQTNPPIQVPVAYKEAARQRFPGGVMFVDAANPQGGVRTAFEVNLNLQHLLLDIQDVRGRIRSAYYADMFLMLANDTRSNVTATEIAERHEEKLLMLGPVLERLHNELLSPLIDRTFDRCAEAGILPPPPRELQNQELNIEFISVLAQAQRMVSAQGMDRLLGTVGSIINIWPEARDKVDIDQMLDDYGDLYGVNPEIIRPDDDVKQLREERAAAQQAASVGAAAPEMAKAAKDASQVDTNALQDVLSMFSGYASPAPAEV